MSSESSEDPVKRAVAGMTEGFLNWAVYKIKEIAIGLRDRKIKGIIQDVETIIVAHEQRKTSEFGLFKQYVEDYDLRVLYTLGMTLRRYEKDPTKITEIRNTIRDKWGFEGLHIAEFFQNGFFGKFLGNIVTRNLPVERLKLEIEDFFKNMENCTVFVKEQDHLNFKTAEAKAKLLSHSPETLIICGSGNAVDLCKRVYNGVIRTTPNYVTEIYEAPYKTIYFLNRSLNP
jgi:hypothetical protein